MICDANVDDADADASSCRALFRGGLIAPVDVANGVNGGVFFPFRNDDVARVLNPEKVVSRRGFRVARRVNAAGKRAETVGKIFSHVTNLGFERLCRRARA